MKKKTLISSVVVTGAILSLIGFALQPNENGYVYTESDITLANPNIQVGMTEYSMETNIDFINKNTIVLTILGTIKSVGDPISWIDETGARHGTIPVTIEVNENTKNTVTKEKLEKGETITFYLDGLVIDGQYYLHSFEPRFEIGEKVIVHLGTTYQGPDGKDGDNYFVELGKYGKYTIVGDKAYNENFPQGKPIKQTLEESL